MVDAQVPAYSGDPEESVGSDSLLPPRSHTGRGSGRPPIKILGYFLLIVK